MAQIKEQQKQEVKELYQQKRMSMQEIADGLGVDLGAVVYFMRKHKIKRRNASDANAVAFSKKKATFVPKHNLTKQEKKLKAMGAMLYWGEGYKTEKSDMVDFANSDPDMIAFFLHFLRTCYKITEKKLRVYLYCYSNQDVDDLINFWSKLTNIPKEQFQKPYVRDDYVKDGRKMKYGMIHVRYYDKKLLNELRNLIELQKEEFSVGSEVVKRIGL